MHFVSEDRTYALLHIFLRLCVEPPILGVVDIQTKCGVRDFNNYLLLSAHETIHRML